MPGYHPTGWTLGPICMRNCENDIEGRVSGMLSSVAPKPKWGTEPVVLSKSLPWGKIGLRLTEIMIWITRGKNHEIQDESHVNQET